MRIDKLLAVCFAFAGLIPLVSFTTKAGQDADSSVSHIDGRVQGAGGGIAEATVTLSEAGPDVPRKLAETQTSNDGSFAMTSQKEILAGTFSI